MRTLFVTPNSWANCSLAGAIIVEETVEINKNPETITVATHLRLILQLVRSILYKSHIKWNRLGLGSTHFLGFWGSSGPSHSTINKPFSLEGVKCDSGTTLMALATAIALLRTDVIWLIEWRDCYSMLQGLEWLGGNNFMFWWVAVLKSERMPAIDSDRDTTSAII